MRNSAKRDFKKEPNILEMSSMNKNIPLKVSTTDQVEEGIL